MLDRRLGSIAACTLVTCAVAVGQQSQNENAFADASSVIAVQTGATPTSCNPWTVSVLPADLSFRQKACLQLAQLASPGLLLTAGFAAGYAHWRNEADPKAHNSEEFTRRVANYYARRTARASAELLVGYLHHEDPRLRISGEQGAWRRTRFALLSVVESPDRDGSARLAFAPLAGALGSGFTSMAVDLHHNNLDNALIRSGIVYSHYFVSALLHEFRPELRSLAPHIVRKYTRP